MTRTLALLALAAATGFLAVLGIGAIQELLPEAVQWMHIDNCTFGCDSLAVRKLVGVTLVTGLFVAVSLVAVILAMVARQPSSKVS